jgi:hypothetical protein
MVEAAGVEPASLINKPAATTCLAGEDFLPCDYAPARFALPSPHEIFSTSRARSPRLIQPAVASVPRSRCPGADVEALRPRELVLD